MQSLQSVKITDHEPAGGEMMGLRDTLEHKEKLLRMRAKKHMLAPLGCVLSPQHMHL